MLKEFKDFAFKGNVMDMAVGIIIGSAFTTVVKSLVDDVLMPILGLITGGLDFSNEYLVLKGEVPENASLANAQQVDGANLLTYGNFITSLISFLIVAFVLFLILKKFVAALEARLNAPEEEEEKSPVINDDIKLLTEIRDLLKEGKA